MMSLVSSGWMDTRWFQGSFRSEVWSHSPCHGPLETMSQEDTTAMATTDTISSIDVKMKSI